MEEFNLDFQNKKPKELYILPLRDIVIYPGMITPLPVGRERSLKTISKVMQEDRMIALVPQKKADKENIDKNDLYQYGSLGLIHKVLKAPDESLRIVVQSISRIKIKDFIDDSEYLKAKIEYPKIINKKEYQQDINALKKSLINLFTKLINLSNFLPQDILVTAMNIEDIEKLAYYVASNLALSLEEHYKILEISDIKLKLEKIIELLSKEIYFLELGKKIQSEVHNSIGKNQKEYFLREQINAIKKELGEDDDKTREINEIKAKVKKLKLNLEAKNEIKREISRLEKIPTYSSEYSVIRTYIDWFIKLPWNDEAKENLDIKKAREILDKEHYGQEKLKERIIEYLCAYKLKKEKKKTSTPTILCFVGPPGVGKTSIAKSIANALNRNFVRMSLGGIRDEAEIRGHRRTYVGSLPGRIIQGLSRCKTNNPVFVLDEIDKMGISFQGDPASALLEVLDPEQNKDFRDHYLDVPFDLSKILFITTANILDPLPPALKDRMEIIELSSYTLEEKINIAQKHLIPRQLKEYDLTNSNISFSKDSIEYLITNYTREAGVRNLERNIASIFRKSIAKMQNENIKKIEVDKKIIREFLKKPKFYLEKEIEERMGVPGIAIGLSWTQTGGDILFIEATKLKAKRNLRLTGQLGEVMKESAQIALSYVYSNSEMIGFDPSIIENSEIHLHVPEGAIPKDGPSAGITIATVFISLLTGKLVKSNLAMTGEITLTGKILPIGGVKEKVLAAHRVGINEIILPKRNQIDLEEDVPENIRNRIKFYFVSDMKEILNIAFMN